MSHTCLLVGRQNPLEPPFWTLRTPSHTEIIKVLLAAISEWPKDSIWNRFSWFQPELKGLGTGSVTEYQTCADGERSTEEPSRGRDGWVL